MNICSSLGRRIVAAIALLTLTCGTASQVWCANLWVSYYSSGGIESYKPAQLKKSGTPTPIQLSTFDTVTGLAFDKSHNLWAVINNDEVVEFTKTQLKHLKQNPNPTPAVVITSASAFADIYGCNFDRQGNLWIVDYNADSIFELSKAQLAAGSGDVTPAIVISSPDMDGPNFVTIDKAGNAWVDNENGQSIAEFSAAQLTSSGNKSATVLISDDGNSSLNAPGQIAFDKKGNLWVPNYSENTVVEFAKSQLTASGSPTPMVTLSSTSFSGPWGAVFDSSGKLVVMNYDDAMILKFKPKQLKASGAPVPRVTVQGIGSENYEITFGPGF